MIVESLPVSSERMEQIKRETAADQTMTELKETTLIGWPAQKNNCPRRIQDYWMCRAELTVVDDIVFKGNKIVIPMTLRKEMLQKIHKAHLGEEKCKRQAREVMYWPRMNQEISQTTASCELCFTYRPKQQAEPLMPHPVPNRPYYKIVKGLMKKALDGKYFLIKLMTYRNAPLQNELSPAQIMMGRRIRNNLTLTPRGAHKVKLAKEKQKDKQKQRHDKSARHLPELKPGDHVRLRDITTETWMQQGCVQRKVAPRSYEIQTEHGSQLRRNRVDLRLQPFTQGTEDHQEDTAEASNAFRNGQFSQNTLTDNERCPTVSGSTSAERPKRTVRAPERLIENC
uniref:Gypsy retrotransposon integrase-like protein 1 n=1 Tax=Oncorhynchus mykiss TaxID=8022 RepID=A0A8C7QE35_ONCMY